MGEKQEPANTCKEGGRGAGIEPRAHIFKNRRRNEGEGKEERRGASTRCNPKLQRRRQRREREKKRTIGTQKLTKCIRERREGVQERAFGTIQLRKRRRQRWRKGCDVTLHTKPDNGWRERREGRKRGSCKKVVLAREEVREATKVEGQTRDGV